jgi:hypothetical protein
VRADGSLYAQESALAKGKWVKISISNTGFYKLTYSDLKQMGFSDPTKISIHGYGGFPMEENFAVAEYKDDVPAVAIYRGADYILFYGKGLTKWRYNADNQLFSHENNAYSAKSYYFVTDATPTNDVTTIPFETTTAEQIVDKYDDYMLHEIDKVSLTNEGRPYSGRDMYGEGFDNGQAQEFKFSIPGITPDEGVITTRFVAKIKSGTGTVTVSTDGSQPAKSEIAENTYIYTAALAATPKIIWNGEKSENTTVKVSFSRTNETARLDYIRLQMKRLLQPYGAYTLFRSIESVNKATQFKISGTTANNTIIFDVTDGENIKRIETAINGSESVFTVPAGSLREFAIVDLTKQFPTPDKVGEIKPQNLHGLPQTDMFIISPNALVAQAERIAAIHRQYDNLTVSVLTPDKIYNEFSSGAPEATAIRRFMKMFYDRSTGYNDAPKYLLLFGDGRWDNRKLSNLWKNTSDNYLLTYQTKESLGENSYTTDDYFGFLADNEGADPVAATMHIGIGRITVNTLAQATIAADKIINYITSSKTSSWKNKVCFVADDGNGNDLDPTIHAQQADTLARYVENHHSGYHPVKLYFDAFKRSFSGGKPTYPDIRTNLQKELNEGVFILNYTGHGDALSWSEEKVLTQSDVLSYTHKNLPLWITASCDFAPFDAFTTSTGEDVFLNPKSGGIALFTASRVAYSDPNLRLNRLFMKYLFERNSYGEHYRLGDVMKNAKNDFRSDQIMTFFLLGDPALKLAYPDDFSIVLTEINGVPVADANTFNFRAFERITLKGAVYNAQGETVNDFNGILTAAIYDSNKEIETLNNSGGGSMKYTDYQNMLYTGNDSILNGEFSLSFTVPKDISYSDGFGKINFYASDPINGIEANGAFKNYTVNGTADVSTNDDKGPEILAMFFNTSDFRDGDKTNETPMFAAILRDESGINTGGAGIGHDITLTIDNNPAKSYILNRYYGSYLEGEKGDGIVKFPVPTLETGQHTAELKVWDIFNNYTAKTVNFIVTDNYKPSIIELTAGPSPASDYTNFLIAHNMPESPLSVEIQVFDAVGKMVWSHTENGASEMFYYYNVRWNLTNSAGARLRPGVYFYRAVISSKNSVEVSKSNKLIIVAQ